MVWSLLDHPGNWKELPPKVRERAIDAGNRLLERGWDEARAIAYATREARRWA